MPVQHDHYVPTRSGMLKIYRGSSEHGGHRWEADERPFAFGPQHAWLKDAVVLPWDSDKLLRGAVEDGIIEAGGDSCMVWDGGDEGLAFHHACWELQGSPKSTGPAISASETHPWALVDGYHEQLFEFAELEADGKAWMLNDPASDNRNRDRILSMVNAGRKEYKDPPESVEAILAVDRDWSTIAVRGENHDRKSIVRARMYTIEKIPKAGYTTLLRITRPYKGPKLPDAAEMNALEAFELDLKTGVEKDAGAILVVVGIGKSRAEFLVYARTGSKPRIPAGAEVASVEDPTWAESKTLILSLK
jgi:hypothetical protein